MTPQTLCVASVTLLDGLALVMLAWQAEPRCFDVKHTQNTMQPSKSASTVVVVLTSAHFVADCDAIADVSPVGATRSW